MQVPALRRRALRCAAVAVLALAVGMPCGVGIVRGAAAGTDLGETAVGGAERLAGGAVTAGGSEALGIQPPPGPAIERAGRPAGRNLMTPAIAVLAASFMARVGRGWFRAACAGGSVAPRLVAGVGSVGRRAPPIVLAA